MAEKSLSRGLRTQDLWTRAAAFRAEPEDERGRHGEAVVTAATASRSAQATASVERTRCTKGTAALARGSPGTPHGDESPAQSERAAGDPCTLTLASRLSAGKPLSERHGRAAAGLREKQTSRWHLTRV